MASALVPLHMGDLHAYEQLLVWGLAFGPFVVLFAVVLVVRRRDVAEEESEESQESGTGSTGRTDAPVSG